MGGYGGDVGEEREGARDGEEGEREERNVVRNNYHEAFAMLECSLDVIR